MQTLFDGLLALGRALRDMARYMAGHSETPPGRFPWSPYSVLWGVWWAILLAIIFVFCGQSSKFIYIDF
jgi:hypothetical protein